MSRCDERCKYYMNGHCTKLVGLSECPSTPEKSAKDVMLINLETGEVKAYYEVSKEFYSVPRKYDESIFDEWQELDEYERRYKK